MRVRGAPLPRRVATSAVVVALAWLAVGWAGAIADGGTWVRPGPAQPTIERVDALAAIVSDRPTSITRSDRGPLRVLPALVEAVSGSSSLPPSLTGDVGFPATPFTIGPLAFGLARRGPPSASSR